MKTRHYLKRIKETYKKSQNKCSFVFHCSGLTSHQWRHLKNVFFIESNGSYQTSHKSGPLCFLSTRIDKHNQSFQKTQDSVSYKYKPSTEATLDLFEKSIYDLFTGKSFQKNLLLQGEQNPNYKSPTPADIVNLSRLFAKINSLEGIHMMVLYAQIQSSFLNHVDIQSSPSWSLRFGSSIEANAQAVLSLFFQSCILDVQILTYSLSIYSRQTKIKPKIQD